MKPSRIALLLIVLVGQGACISQRQGPVGPPPADPISEVSASDLRAKGLGFARRGDLTRAQQYLSAAQEKGFDERVVVPEIVKVCVAASRLRAALAFSEPYLERHPEDVGMKYVVGTIHLALGNVHSASSHLSGALQGDQLLIDAAYSLALIAMDENRPQEAREHLEHYLRVRPQGQFASRAKELLQRVELVALGAAQ